MWWNSCHYNSPFETNTFSELRRRYVHTIKKTSYKFCLFSNLNVSMLLENWKKKESQPFQRRLNMSLSDCCHCKQLVTLPLERQCEPTFWPKQERKINLSEPELYEMPCLFQYRVSPERNILKYSVLRAAWWRTIRLCARLVIFNTIYDNIS